MRLAPEEEVLLDLRPHGGRMLLPVLVLLVVAAGTGYALAVGDAAERVAAVAVGALLVGLLVVVPWLRWRAERLVLTTERLLLRRGVLSRRGRDVPLGRVLEVSFRRSLRERLLGRGTLVVHTAGEALAVPHLRHVEDVQAAVDEARDAL